MKNYVRGIASVGSNRNPSLDILRIFAFSTVVGVHFFMNADFYDCKLVGTRLFAMTVARQFCMICVPLFLVLSGFLMKNKKLEGKFYSGIKKTLATYFFASLACYVFMLYFKDETGSISDFITQLLKFKAAKYSWYVEMYIGLFLLVPFLNILWNNIPTKKYKKVFIFTMLFLTAIPQVINIYNFTLEGWFLTPSMSKSYTPIIPDWWTAFYPITYYFIGCYLRDFDLKLKKSTNLILIALVSLAYGAFCFYRSTPKKFVKGPWQTHASLGVVFLTVLVFVFIKNLDLTKTPEWFKNFCRHVSDLCLGAYLVSYIFDKIFYKMLNEAVTDIPARFNYFLVIVPVIIVCSLLLSFLVNLLSKGAVKGIDKIVGMVRKKIG